MHNILISICIVFFGRILHDLVFNLKLEMFNRGKRLGVICINFIESIVGITILATVITFLNETPVLLLVFGLGSSIGGLLVIWIRSFYDKKLIGQRQYFVRVVYTENEDLIDALTKEGFVFSVKTMDFTDGKKRCLLEGSMENFERKEQFKEILRGRKHKVVTIVPAWEVYWA